MFWWSSPAALAHSNCHNVHPFQFSLTAAAPHQSRWEPLLPAVVGFSGKSLHSLGTWQQWRLSRGLFARNAPSLSVSWVSWSPSSLRGSGEHLLGHPGHWPVMRQNFWTITVPSPHSKGLPATTRLGFLTKIADSALHCCEWVT